LNTKNKIALIGLGSMGYGMASSLLRAGHYVYGFDVATTSVDRFCNEGGLRGTIEDVLPTVDIAVIVVLNTAQTESVLFGESGIVQHMKAGTCVISCATMGPSTARDLAIRCAQNNIKYLDAPISGGAIKAAAGKLSIMASGPADTFAAARPALDAMAETVFELGDAVGSGSAMKSVNQLLAGVQIASMGEAMTFGMKQGIAPEKIVEVITASAGNSWMFENRAPHVVAGDYTPHSAVDIWLKDLGIVLDIAKTEGFSAPITAVAMQQFIAASESGWGKEDDAAVAKVYARNAGITLPGVK
jgi:putative dehydrogenase